MYEILVWWISHGNFRCFRGKTIGFIWIFTDYCHWRMKYWPMRQSQVNLCTWTSAVWPGFEDQERGRKWGCLRGVTLLLERNKQLSIHISPKIPQEKKRGSKMTSKKYEDKETRLALPKKIRLFTLQYRFSLEELLGLIWSLWRQELSCGKSGNNTSAGKSGRAQGEEKKFRIGFLSSRHQARMLFTSVSSSSHYSP